LSLLQNSNAISTGGGYNLESSLRFRRNGSAYLSRTASTAPTSNQKGTFSFWFKRSVVNSATEQWLFSSSLTNRMGCYIGYTGASADQIALEYFNALYLVTNQVFRDPSSWYHMIVAIDTTQATSSDRVKMYINGIQVTSFSYATYPAQNAVFDWMANGQLCRIGDCFTGYTGRYYDGYITEFNYIDGQQLTPSDFGETDTTTGVWKPKEYTGTYGTNGFYLPMKETQQATGFNTVLYTGTGATQTIDGVGFSPDLVWIKARNSAQNHYVANSISGGTKYLYANGTSAELTTSDGITFESDGFQMKNTGAVTNGSGINYVAWCWDAGSSTVSNTDGTITSSVRANPASGFSIVSFDFQSTGSKTVGHGLGSAPKMIIMKGRDSSADAWWVYHTSTGSSDYLRLNSTNATSTNTGVWDGVDPTSDVFSIGSLMTTSNYGTRQIAYCFSEVSGYSKFGSYTGNGSTSGPTITTGFRPAFVMVKRTDTTQNWGMYDNTRNPSNPVNLAVFANASTAEDATTNDDIEFTDTGFQMKNTGGSLNASGGTYIYMAFADTRDAQFNFDASGNKNNWTANNINSNASSETTYDIMNDVATLTDEDTANFATLNPLDKDGSPTFANANLQVNSGAVWSSGISSLAMTQGKWYAEFHATSISFSYVGLAQEKYSFFNGTNLSAGIGYANSGLIYVNDTDTNVTGSTTSYASYTTGDVLGVAYDADSGKVYIHKNGTWLNSGNPVSGTGQIATVTPSRNWRFGASTYNSTINANFGQRPFAYTPPTGYKKLNTYNLPDSTIKDGSQYMNTVLYTGNGGTNAITGVGFSPDLVWYKRRNIAADNNLFDTIRGATKWLSSNKTNAETTISDSLTSFNSDGFTLGADGGSNASGSTFVSWNWRGSDSSPVSNTDGTITSTVSANTDSGFSVITFTGNGTAGATIGHGLGAVPKFIVVKNRTYGVNWRVYHASLGATKFLSLNLTNTVGTSSLEWNNTTPTSSVITVGTSDNINRSGDNIVMYAFAEVEGFSKFGSYTGNGSTDGPFVYTGFRPAFVLFKVTSATDSWIIHDTTRDTYNVASKNLYPNGSFAEDSNATNRATDFLSNGFKIRSGSYVGMNQSGATYIYMAFAENPFKQSLAR